MAIRITVDGQRVDVAPARGAEFSLPELQAVVGGYIEAVYLRDGTVMMVNEDGKRLALAFNAMATRLARERGFLAEWDWIVGDVIVGTRREFGGPNGQSNDGRGDPVDR